MQLTIETKDLFWKYKDSIVLNGINLSVQKGSIYGFLGHNGAGKTTTIKLLVNLLKATPTSIKLFGKDLQSNRIESLKKIGALIENPGLYGHLSGYENLKIKANIFNCNSKRIQEVLSIVKLEDVGQKKTSDYSQGMKQRLGIALALLNDPELLILDEPTNGLDPNGIIEIRNLLQNLSSQGKTIFISSHLLSEVEKFASHVGILHNGNLAYQGLLSELKEISLSTIVIGTKSIEKATKLLMENSIAFKIDDSKITITESKKITSAEINYLLNSNGILVDEIYKQENSLEDLFFQFTS